MTMPSASRAMSGAKLLLVLNRSWIAFMVFIFWLWLGKSLFQFQRECSDALAENFAGQFVSRIGRDVGRFLSGLTHCAAETAEAVHAIGLHRHFAEADPDHAVLHRQRVKILQR